MNDLDREFDTAAKTKQSLMKDKRAYFEERYD